MRHTIRFATLVFGLGILICATAAHGQSTWHVLERTVPAPVSRADWISVGGTEAQRDGWRITRAPTSFALASAQADVNRLSDRFKVICDKSFNVYRDPRTNTFSVSRDAVGGQILQRTGLCCEDAFDLAFPTPDGTAPATSDCRTLSLLSVPGASVRPTRNGWRSTSGIPVRIPTAPPVDIPAMSSGPTSGGGCRAVRTFNQPQSQNSSGRITVEAATIRVIDCPGRGEIWIYQYTNRSGFRAIQPPNWGTSIGGRDFQSFDEAVLAVVKPTDDGPGRLSERDRIFLGTWQGTGAAKGITLVVRPDGTATCVDTRPGNEKNNTGKWGRDPDRVDFIITPCNYGLWFSGGKMSDSWGNVYVK